MCLFNIVRSYSSLHAVYLVKSICMPKLIECYPVQSSTGKYLLLSFSINPPFEYVDEEEKTIATFYSLIIGKA